MIKLCAGPYALYTLNFHRTVSTLEYATETHSDISKTFHNHIEKQNAYQSKSRRQRPEPTPTSFSSPMYTISYLSGTVKAIC